MHVCAQTLTLIQENKEKERCLMWGEWDLVETKKKKKITWKVYPSCYSSLNLSGIYFELPVKDIIYCLET